MCGIFGYAGHKNKAADIILEGLKLLEYRGYDSWGIAAKVKNEKLKVKSFGTKDSLIVEKHIGKIGSSHLGSQLSAFSSQLSIGHTRWATHGGVTAANAHPHMDCAKSIAVVHNGIVENFQELKADLIKKGHKFISETDTEVIPHLIEQNLKVKGFATSVRDAFNCLSGMNAIVVANAVSSEIIAAKNGSPLIIGIGKNEYFISSDITGIVKHTDKVIFLKDNEMVILGKSLQLLSLPAGKRIHEDTQVINWKFVKAEIGKFKHFMIKEIYDQPQVVKNIAENYARKVDELARKIEKAKGTFFIGAGTAHNASLAGVYLFSKIAEKHVNTALASEFNYLEDFLTRESLVIAFSQSGETIDVVEPLNRAKEKGARIIAITNSLGSTIYRMADWNVLLNAGSEKAVASTKAYAAKLAILIFLVYALKKEPGKAKKILLQTADEIDRILKEDAKIKKIAEVLSLSGNIYIIGRGVSYPSALEGALKIKEVSYIPTEGMAGGELKHGTIALVAKGTPVIVFAPFDETYNSIISNAIEIKSRGGVIIGISHRNNSVFNYFIEVKDLGVGSYLAQIVPIQLLAYYIAVLKKLDPDKPRNLAKSVTVK